MFVKCAKMDYVWPWKEDGDTFLYKYARDVHYPNDPGTYLRACWIEPAGHFGLTKFYFTIDGNSISADTAHELFKDDYPGHNDYNPNGLFSRDYVFKQFHREKPYFHGYFDIKKNDYPYAPYNFDPNCDNYVFTQGDFSKLAKLVPL